jgi:hypothetical protein
MYVCIMYAYMKVHMYVCMNVCMYASRRVFIYGYMYMHYVCTCYVCVCVCVCVCVAYFTTIVMCGSLYVAVKPVAEENFRLDTTLLLCENFT